MFESITFHICVVILNLKVTSLFLIHQIAEGIRVLAYSGTNILCTVQEDMKALRSIPNLDNGINAESKTYKTATDIWSFPGTAPS